MQAPEEIEDRYHYFAKKYHPDRAKSPDAHEKFIKVKEAYETLKDPQKRKAYDRSLPPEEKVTELSATSENSNEPDSRTLRFQRYLICHQALNLLLDRLLFPMFRSNLPVTP